MSEISLSKLKESMYEMISQEINSTFLKTQNETYETLKEFYDIPDLSGLVYEPCVHINSKELLDTITPRDPKPGDVDFSWYYKNTMEKYSYGIIYSNIHLPPDEKVINVKPSLIVEGPAHEYSRVGVEFFFVTTHGRIFKSLPYTINSPMRGNPTPSHSYYLKDGYLERIENFIWTTTKIEIEDAPILSYRLPKMFWDSICSFEKQDMSGIQDGNGAFFKFIGKWNKYMTQEYKIDTDDMIKSIEEQKSRLKQYEIENNELQAQLTLKLKENNILEEKNRNLEERAKKYDNLAEFPNILSHYMSMCSVPLEKSIDKVNNKDLEEFLDAVYKLLCKNQTTIQDLRNEIKEYEIYERKKQQLNGSLMLRSQILSSTNEVMESVDSVKSDIKEIFKKR